jgi:segregation and condensation protein A
VPTPAAAATVGAAANLPGRNKATDADLGNVAGVTQPDPASADNAGAATGFQVRLPAFTGPFDLLLQLIGKQKLEITELSLSKVTDEFIAYIRAMGDEWDLDEASEFLVVAATLLDLKAAKLLPQAEVEDEEDLALLEARDLLFARLLQYKAFKELAAVLAERDAEFARIYPRAVKLEQQFAEALPELVLGIGPSRLAELAVRALLPKAPPVVAIDHIHMVRVSVREHAVILREKLMRLRTATFRALCADCQSTLEIVARFLALLELFREGLVSFDQMTALGELTVQWTGDDKVGVTLEIDEYGDEADPLAAQLAEQPENAEQTEDDEGLVLVNESEGESPE